jgi:sialic acid synthase SpsE
MQISTKKVGPGFPCFVIAEAGVNHNGDLHSAQRLIDAGVQANADAVKFQTFQASRLVTLEAPKAEYQIRTTGAGESQYEMIQKLELKPEAHRELQQYCDKAGTIFLSSAFDEESVDLLHE